MAKNLHESKKNRAPKLFIVIILSFLMVPIIATAILYTTSDNFKYSANGFLGILPGKLGGYFQSQPTREEREELKDEIAKQYITLDEDRIVDKLLLIKGDDIKLYNDLLVQLNRLNPKKMSSVKEGLRKKEMKGDLLIQIAEEMDLEYRQNIDSYVAYYSSLNYKVAVEDIKSAYEKNEISLNDLTVVFEKLSLNISANLLILMDSELSEKILYSLPVSMRRNIEKQISENSYRENELIQLAKIFEEKSANELIDEIGNTQKYNVSDLAVIYNHMTYIKGGEILSRVNDQEFIFNLYNHIARYEELNNIYENRSIGLVKTVEIMKNYNQKVLELVEIYQKMSRQDLARIVEQMMRSNEVVVQEQVSSSEWITYTQQQLIIDVLKKFKPAVIGEVMAQLDTRRATELSRKLVE